MDVKLGFNPPAELNTWSQVSPLHISYYFLTQFQPLYWSYSFSSHLNSIYEKYTKFNVWPLLSTVKLKWIDSPFLTCSVYYCVHISVGLMGYRMFVDQYFLLNVANSPFGSWKQAMIASLREKKKKQICCSAKNSARAAQKRQRQPGKEVHRKIMWLNPFHTACLTTSASTFPATMCCVKGNMAVWHFTFSLFNIFASRSSNLWMRDFMRIWV